MRLQLKSTQKNSIIFYIPLCNNHNLLFKLHWQSWGASHDSLRTMNDSFLNLSKWSALGHVCRAGTQTRSNLNWGLVCQSSESLKGPWDPALGTDSGEALGNRPEHRNPTVTINSKKVGVPGKLLHYQHFVPWLPGRTHLSPNRWRERKPGCLKMQNEERCSPGQQRDWLWLNGPDLIARAFLTEAAVTLVLPVD